MRNVISGTCIILLYLVVPFKSQFLSTLHIISHISLQLDPHHHNHNFNDHDHQHGWLARISISVDDQESTQLIPENISECRFEPPFLTHFIRIIHT